MDIKIGVWALLALSAAAAEPGVGPVQARHRLWDRLLVASAVGSGGEWDWTKLLDGPDMDSSLLATLAGGQPGAPEAVAPEVARRAWRAARPDGALVRPDSPLIPTRDSAAAVVSHSDDPMVAWAYTDDQAQRTAFVFSYDRAEVQAQASFAPSDLGFNGQVMVLNRQTGEAWRQGAEDPFLILLDPEVYAYLEIAPVRPNGLIFFGDQGKFVSDGRKRIAGITALTGGVLVTVEFAPDEKVVSLFGYAPEAPVVRAVTGSAEKAVFNGGNGRYSVLVSPEGGKAGEVRQAQIEIVIPTRVFTAPTKD